MLTLTDLPAVNASLNGAGTLLLLLGYWCIRTGRQRAHKACMIAAFSASVLFLVSYLVYHAQVGSRPFTGQGAIRVVYFLVLVTHSVLAAIVPFLAIVTLVRALRGHYARHRAIARWTFPIWLYVSLTGVVVYAMLYRL